MQAALDLAAYALAATLGVGVLLLGMLAYDIWASDRFRIQHPDYVRLPNAVLDAVREVYDRMKAAYGFASPAERRHLELHLRRMQERVQLLEQRVLDEQAPYYKAVSRREKVWRASKTLSDQVRQMSWIDRRRARMRLEGAATAYHLADEGVQEEWTRGVLRDQVMLEDLRAQGLLAADYVAKLAEQARAYAARGAPPEAPEAWQEPGVEPDAPAPLPGEAAPDAHEGPLPAAAAAAPQGPPAPRESGPRSIGTLTYDRLREALAPMFGRKRRLRGQPVPVDPAPIPASGWTPAPPPPRVAAPGAFDHAVGPPAPVPGNPEAGAGRPPGTQATFGLQDLLDGAGAAAGRRYADASFSVDRLPRGILRQADLSGAGFAGVLFAGRHRYLDCRFANADLSAIRLDPQGRAHQFVRCDFRGARFDASRLGFALFHECDLTGTRWTGARLERIRFSHCLLNGVEWSGAEFVETRMVTGGPPSAERSGPPAEPPPAEPPPAEPPPAEPADAASADAPVPAPPVASAPPPPEATDEEARGAAPPPAGAVGP
jgi:hypothetical protein